MIVHVLFQLPAKEKSLYVILLLLICLLGWKSVDVLWHKQRHKLCLANYPKDLVV